MKILLMVLGFLVRRVWPDPDANLVRCGGCGVRGRWVGGTVVNAEGSTVPPLCDEPDARGRVRAHGPWLPETGQ